MDELQVLLGLGGIIFFILYIWFFFIFWVIWMLIVIGGFILWVMMLIDVSKREFPKPEDRTLWILVVALAGFIGAAIYYFSIKRPADQLTPHAKK